MNREIVLDQHIIEAWGLWWVQWQKDTQAILRQRYQAQVQAARVNHFTELHLLNSGDSNGRDTIGASSTNLPH